MKHMILFIFCAIITMGCASYRAFDKDTSRPAQNRLKKTRHNGLVIAAEDYSDSQKSIKYFDRDLKSLGYIPIYICISNVGQDDYILRLNEVLFTYEDGLQVKLSDYKDVIEVARASYTPALATIPLVLPVPFIWSSISDANFYLEKDYQDKALRSIEVSEGNDIFGFIFVEVPAGREEVSIRDALLEMAVVKKAGEGTLAEIQKFNVSISDE